MHDNAYWLISITSDSARVSLVDDKVKSQGQEISWEQNDSESLLKAIDTSLSALNNDTVSNCAFIIPPSWVGGDGRIFEEILKNLKYICQKLKLHPLGFISHDDAFVDSYNHDDSFPGSYVLVYFGPTHYQISLVYLGQIKKRHVQNLEGDFLVSKFEEILSGFDTSSALPPKIIVTGSFTSQIVDDLTNYNWLSKNNIETFLHLPEVISIDLPTLDQIFIDTIKKQISPNIVDVTPIVADQIEETDANSLGFSPEDSPIEVVPKPISIKPKVNFSIPKFKFPKISFNYLYLLPLTLLPFLPILPLFFATVDLTIYQNPVEFTEVFDLTLDPASNVSRQSFDLSVGTSLATTGKKEVGQKALGEVVVFNKLDRSVSVNKGLVITDSTGKKFETTNNILLPASTYNLDTGVINMGQVKAAVAAQVIGPEYNLSANTAFLVKDDTNLLAKSTAAFTGGTKEQVAIVTADDKVKVLESAKLLLKNAASSKINSQKSPDNTILDSTMVYENQKTVYNREIGEETDVLSLNLSAKVNFLYLNLAQKQDLISTLFPQKNSLATLDKNSASVDINYLPGKLTLMGRATPTINQNQLKSELTGKKESDLKSILNTIPRYYQHNLNNSLWFINLLHRLPTKPNLINIIVKN